MFMASLLTVPLNWRQCKSSSTSEWISMNCHSIQLLLACSKCELWSLKHHAIWKRQKQDDSCVILFHWHEYVASTKIQGHTSQKWLIVRGVRKKVRSVAGYLIALWHPRMVLMRLILNEEVEPLASRPELATEMIGLWVENMHSKE